MFRRKILFLFVSAFLMLALLLPLMASAEGSSDAIYAESLDEFIQIGQEMKNRCSVMTAQSNDAEGSSGGTARILLRTDGTVLDLSAYPTVMAVRDSANWYILQFASQGDADEALESLSGLNGVLWAEMDQLQSFLQEEGAGDQELTVIESSRIKDSEKESSSNEDGSDSEKLYSSTSYMSWGATNIGADTLSAYLSENGYTNTLVVAVVDSGADTDHSFLKNRLVSGYNFVDMNNKPEDDNGHGSHVSGTIVDCTPGLNVKIMPLKVLDENGEGYTVDVVAGVRWAVEKGAKVINMSLGGSHSSALDSAVKDACNAGVVCVVSSGNDGTNASNSCPAHITAAITVGAVNSSEARATFSNYGSVLDVVAPGVNIKSSVPDGDYASYSGTSMAAPHISALCAMLRLLYPDETPAQIQSLLKDSCRDLGPSGFDNYYGYGIPDMNNVVSNVTLEADQTSLILKTGDTQTVNISCSGTVPSGAKLQASVSTKAVAGAEWLSQSLTEGSTLQIKGLSSGTASVTVSLLSEKEKVLTQMTISVSVKDYTLTVTPSVISMNVGESISVNVSPKDSLPDGAKYRCSFSGNAFSGSWSGSKLTLKALKSANGEMTIEAVSAEEEVLSSAKLPYTLVYNLHMSASPENIWLQVDETLILDLSFDELTSDDWSAETLGNEEIAELVTESTDFSAGRIRYSLKGLSAGSFDLKLSLKNQTDQGSNSITVPVTVAESFELSAEPAQADVHVGCVSTVTITASAALPEGSYYTALSEDEALALSVEENKLSLSGLEEGSGSITVYACAADGRKIVALELPYTVNLVTLELEASPNSIALEEEESQSVKLSASETLAGGSCYCCDTETEYVSISISEDILKLTGLKEGSGSLDVKLYAENGSLLGSLSLPYAVSKKDYQLIVTPESIAMELGESTTLYSKFLKIKEGMLELSADSDALDIEEISGGVDKGWVKDSLTALKTGEFNLKVRLLDSEGNELAATEVPVKITENTKKIEKIKLNKSSLTLKIYGKVKPMALLTAKITPATALNQTLKWKSSNTKVAKVDENGIVSSVGAGTATITAYAQDGSGVKAACTVTVKKLSNSGKLITSCKLKNTLSTLGLGQSQTLELVYTPSNASWQKALFFSSKPSVASIDQNGTIQALKVGKTKITCMAADGSGKQLTFNLRVIRLAEKLSLNNTKATLKKGKTLQLSAAILPENVSITTLSWSSSNTKVATVDENGLVKAVGKGECKIFCSTTDGSGLKVKCKITVK